MKHSTWIIGLIIIFLFLCRPSNVFSKEIDKLSDKTEVEQFIDQFFSQKMKENNVPGVGLIIFKDGEVYLSKGYGYADLEKKVRVDPEQTVFRVASVSKVIMTFALLQLYDQGLIDLEAEASSYLKPDDPLLKNDFHGLKIKHLLSHTEGFPSRDLGSFAMKADDIPPIHQTLISDLKNPVVTPGSVITYGSVGAVVSAHIIETLTGQSYIDYTLKNVFGPLDMKKSTFRQVLTDEMSKDLAITYTYEDGNFAKTNFLYGVTPPSGGLSSTPGDLGRFIMALMYRGEYRGNQVMKPSTVELMLKSQFRGHPSLPGVTYGFFEHLENGKLALVRDGSGYGVTSRLFYIPEENVGYVYFQNIRGDELIDDFQKTFFDHFYPEETEWEKPIPLSAETAKSLEGTYRTVQYHRNVLKIGAYITGMILEVTSNQDGTLHLRVTGPGDVAGWGGFGKETDLIQVEPMLFCRNDVEGYVAFKKVGDKVYLFSGNGYHSTYEKIPWYEKPGTHVICAIIFILTFFFAILFSMYYKLRRLKHNGPRLVTKYISLMGLTGLLNLLYPVLSFWLGYFTMKDGFPVIVFGIPKSVSIILLTPIFTAILAILMVIIAIRITKISNVSLIAKIGFLYVATISILYIPYVIYWHMFPGLTV